MEVKKKTPVNTITRDVKYLAEPTGNKPDLIAITEFEDGELYYRMAGKEE